MSILYDTYKRRINYLRLSVLDRCNLRCIYCMPSCGVQKLEHKDILSDQQIIDGLDIFKKMGIDYLRITGGEPLIRHNILELLARIGQMNCFKEIGLTTNGVNLGKMASSLKSAGVTRVNISLDSLRPGVFKDITGYDYLEQVMEGIKAAHLAGLGPIKINCVYLPGINDNEMDDFFDLALKKPLNVRIIEHMPVLIKDINGSAPEIEDKLTRFFKKSFSQFTGRLSDYLINKDHLAGSGPALSYSFPGMAGSIGIIRSSSKEICSTCNRLRLHANGDLAYCLFAHEFLNIKSLFEKNESFDKIDALIREYVIKKPFCHDGRYTRDRPMSSIGG